MLTTHSSQPSRPPRIPISDFHFLVPLIGPPPPPRLPALPLFRLAPPPYPFQSLYTSPEQLASSTQIPKRLPLRRECMSPARRPAVEKCRQSRSDRGFQVRGPL